VTANEAVPEAANIFTVPFRKLLLGFGKPVESLVKRGLIWRAGLARAGPEDARLQTCLAELFVVAGLPAKEEDVTRIAELKLRDFPSQIEVRMNCVAGASPNFFVAGATCLIGIVEK
jgi:hypothetical protein